MARIVAAAGVPHTVIYPELVATPAGAPVRRRYRAVLETLEAGRPDVLCVLAGDHMNAFFLDNWPTFAVVAAPGVVTCSDPVPGIATTFYPVHSGLAVHIHRACVTNGYDPALSLERTIDHSVFIPMHFLNQRKLPIVPIHVNCFVHPLPSAGRYREFGAMIADAIGSYGPDLRVALVASGSFSLEVGGPQIAPGQLWATPREDWAASVASMITAGETDRLVELATPETIVAAGSAGGEVLPWIALVGAVDGLTLVGMDRPEGEGHGFAAWSLA